MEKDIESISSEIYKFSEINDNLIKGLNGGYLWLSKPKDFNDPYDCYEKLISINVNNGLIKKTVNSGAKKLDKLEKRRLIKKINKNKGEFGKIIQDTVSELYSDIGICCFTHNDYSDILMWSHYANNHKGICLKFDIAMVIEEFIPLIKVNYTSEFKPMDYDYDSPKSLEHFVSTKSKVWQYENEIRKIRLLSLNPSQEFVFPSESLIEIAFGCDTPVEETKRVYSIIHEKYPHVKVNHMKMEESKFELKLIEGYLY